MALLHSSTTMEGLKLSRTLDLRGILLLLNIFYIMIVALLLDVIPVEARLHLEETCYHHCKCDEIILQVNCTRAEFTLVPDLRSNTRILLLDQNSLTIIKKTNFAKVPSLRHMSLSWNKIDDIEDGSFKSQRKVMKLNLRNNELVEVPLALKHMKSLVELDLRWNRIGVLTNMANGERTQEPWSNVTNLKRLHLDHNVLTLLPVLVFTKLIRLEYLSISNNHLVAIPEDALVNLSRLRFINLSFNNLTASYPRGIMNNRTKGSANNVSVLDSFDISTAPTLDVDYASDNSAYGVTGFKGNYELTELYLKENQIQALLSGLFDDLLNLQILHLESNNIEIIENGAFDSLLNLQMLYLNDNQLQTLPPVIFQPLRNLDLLDLNANSISDISPLINTPIFTLTSLFLNGNNLNVILENGFTDFHSLQELYISDNQLSTVPTIKGLSNLRLIDLSSNRIKEVGPVDVFTGTQLQKIYLSENPIETLSYETFGHLQTLHTVDLAGSNYICDCRLQWMLDQEYPHDIINWMYDSYGFELQSSIECREPRLYKGINLNEVRWSSENYKLRCTNYIEAHIVTILLTSWGAILGFFLLLFWIHTLCDFKRKFGTRHPRKKYMAMHYADNPGANPLADETGQITFRTFDSDSDGVDAVDEETTV